MNRLTPMLAGVLLTALLAAPATGQTLAERIAAVKARHAREQTQTDLAGLKTKMLQALLYEKLTVQFEETPVREVFEYLKTSLDVNLIVRYADDPVGHGIDPLTSITLDLAEAPAVDVLQLVLDQCAGAGDCTWQLRRSFIEVGTKERLSVPAARQVRAYPIGDLLYEAPRFVDAPPIGFTDEYWYPYGPYGPYGSYGGYGGSLSGGTIGHSIGGYRWGGGVSQRAVADDPNTPEKKAERAKAIIELIVTSIEPMAWAENGGDWATIRYRDDALIVTAPDYIHRQINGYGPVPPPTREPAEPIPSRPAKRDAGSTPGASKQEGDS
jgi:hypothetical protein